MSDSILQVNQIKDKGGNATGITVADSSANVTINNLTSSTGFPAGHVLQYLHFENSETNALTTSYVNYYENPITLKSASSNVIVSCKMNVWVYHGSGMGIKVYRKVGSGVATTDTAVWTKNTDDGNVLTLFFNPGGGEMNMIQEITGQDVISGRSVGDVLYYGLFLKKRSVNVNCPADYAEDGFFQMNLIEVQK